MIGQPTQIWKRFESFHITAMQDTDSHYFVVQLDEFVAWLNPKGHREIALKTALTKWWVHITAGIRKRIAVCYGVNPAVYPYLTLC